MKLFDNRFDGSDFTKEEVNKLRIKYLEICARVRNSEKYSTEDAEYVIDHITRVGDYLFDPFNPHLLINFYDLVDELVD